MKAKITPLSFADDHIEAFAIVNTDSYPIENESIVVNLSNKALSLQVPVDTGIPAWRSRLIGNGTLIGVECAVVLRVKEPINIGSVITGPWELFSNRLPPDTSFPKDTPLWISSQDSLRVVDVDISALQRSGQLGEEIQRREVKVNLWYATGYTDCAIHNHSDDPFLEVHTQVLGTGRMQKFHEPDSQTMYEQVIMSPGDTHDPFFVISDPADYPWHRYYADDDCIWMAIEFHDAGDNG